MWETKATRTGENSHGVAEHPPMIDMEGFDAESLNELLAKYRGQAGTLIPLLQGTQELYGFLPDPAMAIIAAELDQPLSALYGVATFYAHFRLVPRGKHVVRVCPGTACHVSGAPIASLEVGRHLVIEDGGIAAGGNDVWEAFEKGLAATDAYAVVKPREEKW